MCDSQVSGCQFAFRNAVKAQRSPFPVRPERTSGFFAT
jgi:hypothetical protein